MDIKKFFQSLLPSFERSRITDDIERLQVELKDTILPAYKQAAAILRGRELRSTVAKSFNDAFVAAFPQYRRTGFGEGTVAILSELPAKLQVLDEMVLELFAKDVTRDTISYRKAAILQYLEKVSFAEQYAGRALLRYVAAETYASVNELDKIDSQLTPAELKWLIDNQRNYLAVMKLLSQSTKDLAETLKEIPDIAVVPERIQIVNQTVGATKLDPLRLNFLSADWNPIYHLRVTYSEYQVKQYHRSVEEKRVLELRLMALKEALAGKQDARLQKTIEYTEGRLARLDYSIKEMEEHYS